MVWSSLSTVLSSKSISTLLSSFSQCWQPLLTAFPFTRSFITESCPWLGFSALIHIYKAGMGTWMAPAYPLAPDIGRLQSVHPVYPLILDPRSLPALKQMLSRSLGPNFSRWRPLKLRMTKQKRANPMTFAKEERRMKMCWGENHPPEINRFIEWKKKNLASCFISLESYRRTLWLLRTQG